MNDLLLALIGLAVCLAIVGLVIFVGWLVFVFPVADGPGLTEQIIEVCTTNMGGDYETLMIIKETGCP